jgi:ubiquitin-protein ligase
MMIQICTNGMVIKNSIKKKIFLFNYSFLVGIFGPPDTLYEGGYFKADMEFPTTYPFAPPKVKKFRC